MIKRDFRKELGNLYSQSASQVSIIEVPSMNFLMIDGQGDPNHSPAYRDAVEALFSVSYAAKFLVRKSALGIDFGVLPLEGLWWCENMAEFSIERKSDWTWTAMIMQPEVVSVSTIEAALAQASAKKALPAFSQLRLEAFAEGPAMQILHRGPFSDEGPTIALLHEHIEKAGRELRGKHHEIYLSDIRKGNPANWKTIIRQPCT